MILGKILKKLALFLLISVVIFLFGFHHGRRFERVRLSPETKIIRDTVWRIKPAPLSTIIIGSIPHVYFFTDTLWREDGTPEVKTDSATISFPIIQRTYSDPDSLYYAIISGPAVDDCLPTLDSIAVRREQEITIVKGDPLPPPRWAIGPTLETGYSKRFYALIGASAQYTTGRLSSAISAGIDPVNHGLGARASIRFDLVRIK